MAFIKENLSLQYWGGGSGVRVWTYTSTDDEPTLLSTAYFAEAGIEPQDIVLLVSLDDVTHPTVNNFTAHVNVDSAGTATIIKHDDDDLELRTAA